MQNFLCVFEYACVGYLFPMYHCILKKHFQSSKKIWLLHQDVDLINARFYIKALEIDEHFLLLLNFFNIL